MAISFEQFLNAIIGQESGGNYQAVSPDDAVGKYQILSSNLASWGREILGRPVTRQEFLSNPALQDQLAQGKLRKYFDTYGPEGAASAWYTGSPNAWKSGGGGDSAGGPSAAGYVQSVMSRAGGSSGTQYTSSTASATAVSSPATKAPMTAATLAGTSGLGPYLQLFNTVPELKKLMAEAINKGMTAEDFADQIHKSQWWTTHSDTVRQTLAEKVADPATYQKNLQQIAAKLQNLSTQLGVGLSGGAINYLAGLAYTQGWSDDQIKKSLAQHWDSKGKLAGQAADVYNQLSQAYSAYGQTTNDATLRYRTQQILLGNTDVNVYTQQAKQAAISMFPGLTEQMNSGLTLSDIASPYKQSMAHLLEIDPQSLTTTDRLIKSALQGSDATGRQPMALWQFEDSLRKDPRWQKTDNAKQTYATALSKIGQDWGYAG